MSQNTDPQISVAHQGGKTDAPKGVIPAPAASNPNPSPRAASTAVAATFVTPYAVVSTVA